MTQVNILNISPGKLTLQQLRAVQRNGYDHFALNENAFENINKSAEAVQQVIKENRVVYGINTGFGLLASTRIKDDELEFNNDQT